MENDTEGLLKQSPVKEKNEETKVINAFLQSERYLSFGFAHGK